MIRCLIKDALTSPRRSYTYPPHITQALYQLQAQRNGIDKHKIMTPYTGTNGRIVVTHNNQTFHPLGEQGNVYDHTIDLATQVQTYGHLDKGQTFEGTIIDETFICDTTELIVIHDLDEVEWYDIIGDIKTPEDREKLHQAALSIIKKITIDICEDEKLYARRLALYEQERDPQSPYRKYFKLHEEIGHMHGAYELRNNPDKYNRAHRTEEYLKNYITKTYQTLQNHPLPSIQQLIKNFTPKREYMQTISKK